MNLRTKVILTVLAVSLGTRLIGLRMEIAAVHASLLEKSRAVVSAGVADLPAEFRSAMRDGREKQLLPPLLSLMSRQDAVYGAILDAKGKIAAHSDVTLAGGAPGDAFTLGALASGHAEYREKRWNGAPVVEVAVPVWADTEGAGEEFLVATGAGKKTRLGTVILGVSLTTAAMLQKEIALRMLLINAAILALIIAFILWFVNVILQPLEMLTEGTNLIRAGHYGGQIPVASGDEIGRLTGSFNAMSRTLSDTTVSRNYLDGLLTSMPDAVVVTDAEGLITRTNPAAIRPLGYGKDGLIGEHISVLYPRDERLKEIIANAFLDHSHIGSMEVFIARADGSLVPMLFSAAALHDEDGRFSGIVAVGKNITEQKKMAENISRLASIVESCADPILSCNAEGVIITWNQAAAAAFGYTAGEILGRSIAILAPGGTRLGIGVDLGQLNVSNHSMQYDTQRRTKDGAILDMAVSVSVIRKPDGNILGYSAIYRDMTEQKRMEAMLRQSDKLSAIGQLAAGVAHEVNNPLGIILGFAQSLVKRVNDKDPVFMPLHTIEREALRCKNLVQNLLVFSRTSKPEQRETLDLNKVVTDSMVLLAAQAKTRSVELVSAMHQLPLTAPANRTNIQQVLINLGNNAMDSMPEGGKLTISTAQRGASAEIRVADTGAGIAPEIMKKIFDPFFTTKEVGKGTGLGLSLVYEIIRGHDGSIEVESEPGEGTVFTVLLPLAGPGTGQSTRPITRSMPSSIERG